MARNKQEYGLTYTAFLFALSLGLLLSYAPQAEAREQVVYNNGGVVSDDREQSHGLKRANPDKKDIIKKGDTPAGMRLESFDAWKKNMQSFSNQPTNFIENDKYLSIKALVRSNIHLPEDNIAKIVAAQYGYSQETAELITHRAIPIVAKEINLEAEEKQHLRLRALAKRPIAKLPPAVALPPAETLPYEHPNTVMSATPQGTVDYGPVVDTNSSEPSGTAWKEIDVPVVYSDTPVGLSPKELQYYNSVRGSVGYNFKEVPYEYPMDPVAPVE